jgi:hypothetical protein
MLRKSLEAFATNELTHGDQVVIELPATHQASSLYLNPLLIE